VYTRFDKTGVLREEESYYSIYMKNEKPQLQGLPVQRSGEAVQLELKVAHHGGKNRFWR
jgi:hypothetical protein